METNPCGEIFLDDWHWVKVMWEIHYINELKHIKFPEFLQKSKEFYIITESIGGAAEAAEAYFKDLT